MSTSAVEAANKNDNLSEILKSPKTKVRIFYNTSYRVFLYNAQCFAVVKDLSDIPLPDVQEKPSLESILNEVRIRSMIRYKLC